jgi:hypothetical protein
MGVMEDGCDAIDTAVMQEASHEHDCLACAPDMAEHSKHKPSAAATAASNSTGC